MDFFEELKKITQEVRTDEPMARHTSFKIGGNADFMVFPRNAEEIKKIAELSKKHNIPLTVLGNGSNVLVSDGGIEGIVVKISDAMSKTEISGETIVAEAGILLSKLSSEAMSSGLSGLEFASGIPGTLGGAIVMNAGAYGGEMSDIVIAVGVMDENGEIFEIPSEKANFGYRTSVFSDYLVLYAKMKLKKGNKEEIKNKMSELNARRREKQPLNFPSAGSTFKRPEGYFAGKLIEDTGLKGFKIGGARVSEKHSGFVVNEDNASAADVKRLIEHIEKTVKNKFGVVLETEVKYIGKED